MFSTPIGLKTCPGLTCADSARFQKKIPKISHGSSLSPKYLELGLFTLLFCKKMYQDSKCTCTAIVLLIKSFVRRRSRRRRGLLKLPNKHLMTGPKGNSEFCLRPATLRSRGNKTHCFPRGQSLSVLLYLPNQNRKKLRKYDLYEWQSRRTVLPKLHHDSSLFLRS